MKRILAFALILLGASFLPAQQLTRIDGMQHPELIPDKAARRAIFLMHSHFSTNQENTRSEQLHANIGLTVADHEVYDQILRDFRRQYDELAIAQ